MTAFARFEHVNLTGIKQYAIGALAISAASAKILDLGNPHGFKKIIAVARATSSAGATLIIEQSHNGNDASPTWVRAPAADLSDLQATPAAGATMIATAVPTARWIKVTFTNGATAQTALDLEITTQS